jgi:hypothetical protein
LPFPPSAYFSQGQVYFESGLWGGSGFQGTPFALCLDDLFDGRKFQSSPSRPPKIFFIFPDPDSFALADFMLTPLGKTRKGDPRISKSPLMRCHKIPQA